LASYNNEYVIQSYKRLAEEHLEPLVPPWSSHNYPWTYNIPVYSFTGHPNLWHCFCRVGVRIQTTIKMYTCSDTRGCGGMRFITYSFASHAGLSVRWLRGWCWHWHHNRLAELFTHGWLHCCGLITVCSIPFSHAYNHNSHKNCRSLSSNMLEDRKRFLHTRNDLHTPFSFPDQKFSIIYVPKN
jgi:hypothetical protein